MQHRSICRLFIYEFQNSASGYGSSFRIQASMAEALLWGETSWLCRSDIIQPVCFRVGNNACSMFMQNISIGIRVLIRLQSAKRFSIHEPKIPLGTSLPWPFRSHTGPDEAGGFYFRLAPFWLGSTRRRSVRIFIDLHICWTIGIHETSVFKTIELVWCEWWDVISHLFMSRHIEYHFVWNFRFVRTQNEHSRLTINMICIHICKSLYNSTSTAS